MVAFAGRKYAARSIPAFVANGTYIVILTSFTLVVLRNLLPKLMFTTKVTTLSRVITTIYYPLFEIKSMSYLLTNRALLKLCM